MPSSNRTSWDFSELELHYVQAIGKKFR